jgi:hypothetical protein
MTGLRPHDRPGAARVVRARAVQVLTTIDQIISEVAVDWTSALGSKLAQIPGY